MTDKAFVEITNICNLNCSFCAGHRRKSEYMSTDNFKMILDKLSGRVTYLYLHLMGEPLTHPKLKEILSIADGYDFRIMLTTNGTLLEKCGDILLASEKLYKISISVHSFEGTHDTGVGLDTYLDNILKFAQKSAGRGIITVFRLWNDGGADKMNADILERIHSFYGNNQTPNRSGERLADKTFIEFGEKFEWPDREREGDTCERFCYALRDQFGVLVDGTVVPCCLDHDGELALGNIFDSELDEILNSKRAKAIYDGFTRREAVEKYCQTCKKNPGA